MNAMQAVLTTAGVLSKMLKEDTGKHPLDSGMLYGYGYEKRKDIDYSQTPDHYIQNGSYFKSTYHHLLDNLIVDTAENARFMQYAGLPVNEDRPWSSILHDYCRMMKYEALNGDNTYNYSSFLDVDFQWYEVDDKEDYNDRELVVIMTHNGCDARGGYSAPVWFLYKENYRDDSNLLSFNTGYLYCSKDSEHRFETYDGYQWTDSDSGTGSVDIETDKSDNFICPTCGGILQA